jgi:wyosine [tRNA(Phe)-imidazoG37] synthetase (radical SAM superfamily)
MEREHVRQELYRIVLKGHLDHAWSEWFAGLTITRADNGETILTGPVVDQTALHGVLIKIRDLGLPLLALTRIDPDSVERRTAACVTRQEEVQE